MSRTVFCLGDVMVDVTARLTGALAQGSDTPASITTSPGGSAANTACWLAGLGTDVVMIGRVGADAAGRDAVRALRAAGVRPRVALDPSAPTGTCLVLVTPDGERTMVPDAGANHALRAQDLPALDAGDHLHVSGYSLFAPGVRPVARAALADALAAGATVSVGAASSAPLAAVGATAFLSWVPDAAILFANEAEADVLGDALARRAAEVVVTRGPGRASATRDAGWWMAGADAVPVVDSTGAGDAFAAGYLAARLGGAAPDAALVEGHRVAALAVGHPGARPAPGRPTALPDSAG